MALVPAAVGALAVVMQINDDPDATTAATVTFVVAAFVFTLGAAWLYRPMLQKAPIQPPVAPDMVDHPGQHFASQRH